MPLERRESYRCQISDNEPPAILRVGSRDHVVRLYEESAGGIGVLADRRPRVKVGQTVVLATSAGRCEAKVIHVTQQQHGRTRIGLKRVGELTSAARGAVGPWLHSMSARLGKRETPVKLALIAVLCFVFFLWGSQLSSGAGWLAKTYHLVPSRPAPNRSMPTAKSAERQATHEEALATNYLRLDQLKSPRFASRLKLTSAQQQKIRGIIRETTTALSALYEHRENLSTEDWSELGLQLIQTSWDEIQSVMTDQQQAQWKAMTGRAESEPVGQAAGRKPDFSSDGR